jgi:hypothetical protein
MLWFWLFWTAVNYLILICSTTRIILCIYSSLILIIKYVDSVSRIFDYIHSSVQILFINNSTVFSTLHLITYSIYSFKLAPHYLHSSLNEFLFLSKWVQCNSAATVYRTITVKEHGIQFFLNCSGINTCSFTIHLDTLI